MPNRGKGGNPDYNFLPEGADPNTPDSGIRVDAVIATGKNFDNIISGAIGDKAGRQADVIVIEIGAGQSGGITDEAVKAWKPDDVAPMSPSLQRIIVVRNTGGYRNVVLDMRVR
jgi:hypothetical protein